MTNTIRVLTVDDHELLRQGIYYSLLSIDDIELVAEAQEGEEALHLCGEIKPDVVLMDMRLPGEMDGIATTKVIRRRYPQVQVLALSSFFDKDLVQGAMQAGAIGYLVKGVSGEELANAISHFVGALLAVVGLVLMVSNSMARGNVWVLTSTSIFVRSIDVF